MVDEDGSIWFRQSWLDTADRCLERGRLALVLPTWNEASNDAAVIGTGTHAAIQMVLDKTITPDQAGHAAYTETMNYCEGNEVRWTRWELPGQLAVHAQRCAEAFVRELLPHVEPGGQTEVEFKVPLFERYGHTVGITGTSDYVTRTIYDWKTGSRKFQQREKQRTAIQPTVYAVAAAHGAFGEEFQWPVTFRYGVMIRGNEKATTQLFDVQRNHAHEGWLFDKLESYMDLAKALGTTRHWPRDEDHFLCNEVWCPWWSACKGARLSTEQDIWSA